MSTVPVITQPDSYYANLFHETAEKIAVPSAVGFAAGGPAGAAASAGIAFGLFFIQKAAEFLAPDLKGNRYAGYAFDLAGLGFTSINSAYFTKGNWFCISETGVLKTGNFTFDVAKSALSYLLGKGAQQSLGKRITSSSVLKRTGVKTVLAASGVVTSSCVFFCSNELYMIYNYSGKYGHVAPLCMLL